MICRTSQVSIQSLSTDIARTMGEEARRKKICAERGAEGQTHDIDTLIAGHTDFGALRTEINTDDTHSGKTEAKYAKSTGRDEIQEGRMKVHAGEKRKRGSAGLDLIKWRREDFAGGASEVSVFLEFFFSFFPVRQAVS